MDIQLLGFPTTLGLPRTAYRHAPEAIREAGLIDRLTTLGAHVSDLGDMPLESGIVEDPVSNRIEKVVAAARQQADFWLNHHRAGELMLTLGGDHSTSLGTIWALAELGQPFDIVWIDAHGDFNVIETSPTGNPHGMVLALACGLLPDYMQRQVSPSVLRLWGIRDLDAGERALLERERVDVLNPDRTRQTKSRLLDRLGPNVFLSFDIDSVEPSEAPGTMTPVPNGFRTAEALELVEVIARNRNLLAVDIVEFHPDRDQENLTLDLALAVAETVVRSTVRQPVR